MQSSPDAFFGDPTRAAGGNVIGHTSTYRIYLRKSGELVDAYYAIHLNDSSLFCVLRERELLIVLFLFATLGIQSFP